MSLLTPLGLLGLLGLAVLVLIYIIKPNYQSKLVPSTFVWKLSLKYRKKKIPVSQLRNILIFICQLIILTAAALILAQPFIDNSKKIENGDTVIVVDASPSMHAEANGTVRLKRVAEKAIFDAERAFEAGNSVSVILAGDESEFLAQQVKPEQAENVYNVLRDIANNPASYYGYMEPDVDGAMKLAEKITAYTDKVTVTLYTDTEYYNSGEIDIYNVNDPSEWNAAILDVRAKSVDNHYRIEVDVVSYGKDVLFDLNLEIAKPNVKADEEGYKNAKPMNVSCEVYCSNDTISTIVFGYVDDDMDKEEASLIDKEMELSLYDNIKASISVDDSLGYDNEFCLYGGTKPVIDILYSSSMPNNFFPTALFVIQDALKEDWEVRIKEVGEGVEITQGYDIYIYEHTVPKTLPDDGVIFCVNPNSLPSSAGAHLGSGKGSNNEIFMNVKEDHPIMNNIDVTKISVTQFTVVSNYGDYTPLMGIKNKNEQYPLLLVKDEVDAQIVIMPFSLHYSNLAVLPEFPMILKNTVNHFFPKTVDKHVFETGDKVALDARANKLSVFGDEGMDLTLTIDKLPAEITVSKPGTVNFIQRLSHEETIRDSIYVKIPSSESDIQPTEEILVNPYFYTETNEMDVDLLFYLAMAMVALLFIEWWLKSREQI